MSAASNTAAEERAAFDAWMRGRWPNAWRPVDEKTDKGYYVYAEHNIHWEVWQARAALTQPATAPTIAQLAAQLSDYDEKWTPAEQQQFAEFLKRFPNESSAGIISLGSAWKHGKACATAPVSGWMPIETAPKNMMSRLYLINGFCVQGFVDAAGYLCAQSEVSPNWRRMRGTPTHWMPLPAAPKDAT